MKTSVFVFMAILFSLATGYDTMAEEIKSSCFYYIINAFFGLMTISSFILLLIRIGSD